MRRSSANVLFFPASQSHAGMAGVNLVNMYTPIYVGVCDRVQIYILTIQQRQKNKVIRGFRP